MKPEDLLEHCLNEIDAGRKTPAECAALFPDSPGLEAQLLAAALLKRLEVPTLRPEVSRRIEARLRQKMSARKPTAVRRRRPLLRWVMPLALTTALLFTMVGTVAASSESLPGNPLYSVKRASETAQVILTPASEQALLHITLAQSRLDEIIVLFQLGTVDLNLLTDLTTETETALAEIEDAEPEAQSEVLSAIITLTKHQQAILLTVKAFAPPQAQAGLDRAIAASIHNHGVAQGHLKQGTPSPASASTAKARQTPVPPGQQKKMDTSLEGTHSPGHSSGAPDCKGNGPNSPCKGR